MATTVLPAARILSLDVLRGVAVLGILVMNIQSFSMIEWAYFNPTAYGDLTGINYWIWYLSRLFFDSKFMAIFSMMFGASMLLIIERAREKGHRPFVIHARRNLALLLIGAAHAYLLWSGDILFPYAVCSFFVFLFRHRRPRTQLVAGLVILLLGTLILYSGALQPDSPELQEQIAEFQPTDEMIAEEVAIYRSGWPDQMEHRVPTTRDMHLWVLPFFYFWRVSGMMLIGMALFRWGVLSAERSSRFYLTLIALGVVVGLPMAHMSVAASEAADWAYKPTFHVANLWNYWGSLFVALGWIGVVMLVCRSPLGLVEFSAVASVGRMAFTNYLMQTVLCTTFFYGHGFGQFGRLERLEQVFVVIAVWALQLLWSPWWMKRFHYGPAEWVWRWATYGKRPPMRRV